MLRLLIITIMFASFTANSQSAYHAMIQWTACQLEENYSRDTASALQASERGFGSFSWMRTQVELDSSIPFHSEQPKEVSFQNTVRAAVSTAQKFDGLTLIDIVINSHASANHLLVDSGESRNHIEFLKLKSFLVSQASRLAKSKKTKIRIFLNYCYSGALLKYLNPADLPHAVKFEIYTSTDSIGRAKGIEITDAIILAEYLLNFREAFLEAGLDPFFVLFKSVARFSLRVRATDPQHSIQVWSNTEGDKKLERDLILKLILGQFHGEDRYKLLLNLDSSNPLVGSLEQASNLFAQMLFSKKPELKLSETNLVNYQILQVRLFFSTSPQAKLTLQQLLHHSDGEVRHLALQTLFDYTTEFADNFFREGRSLIYKAYWDELLNPNGLVKNIKLILKALKDLKDISAEAAEIETDWLENACIRYLT